MSTDEELALLGERWARSCRRETATSPPRPSPLAVSQMDLIPQKVLNTANPSACSDTPTGSPGEKKTTHAAPMTSCTKPTPPLPWTTHTNQRTQLTRGHPGALRYYGLSSPEASLSACKSACGLRWRLQRPPPKHLPFGKNEGIKQCFCEHGCSTLWPLWGPLRGYVYSGHKGTRQSGPVEQQPQTQTVSLLHIMQRICLPFFQSSPSTFRRRTRW